MDNIPTGYLDPGNDNVLTTLCECCNDEFDYDDLIDDYGDLLCSDCLELKYE